MTLLLSSRLSFAYETTIAFKPDAVLDGSALTAKVVVHCSGAAPKEKITQILDVRGLNTLGPLDCRKPAQREATDLYVNGIPVMADFTEASAKVNFCITAVSAQQVAGYRADKSFANPCDAPDPVKRHGANPYPPEETYAWVQQFAPLVYLHPDERFYPSNPNNYLQKAALYNAQNTLLIPEGQVTLESLLSLGVEREGYLHHPDKAGVLQEAKCFAFARETAAGDALDISYWIFYEFNGAAEILGRPYNPESGIGHHFGDWEHLTVRTTRDGRDIIGMHFAAHGKEEGTWHWGQVNNPEKAYIKNDKTYKRYSGYQLSEQGQPIAFSAKFTHALYNRAGTIPREITKQLSNDKTGYGEVINCADPERLVLVTDPDVDNPRLIDTSPETQAQSQWLAFPGLWGKEGSRTPSTKGIWFNETP